MFSHEQYRAVAAKYAKLREMATSPGEVREFQKLEQTFTTLADNGQWLADNSTKTVHA